jgi:hypothetical protein
MSSKAHVLKAGYPRWYNWTVLQTPRGGLNGRPADDWEHALERTVGPFSSPLLPSHEVSSFSPPQNPTTICCLTIDPKQ